MTLKSDSGSAHDMRTGPGLAWSSLSVGPGAASVPSRAGLEGFLD